MGPSLHFNLLFLIILNRADRVEFIFWILVFFLPLFAKNRIYFVSNSCKVTKNQEASLKHWVIPFCDTTPKFMILTGARGTALVRIFDSRLKKLNILTFLIFIFSSSPIFSASFGAPQLLWFAII